MKWIPPQVLWSFSPFFIFVHLFSHLFPMKKVNHQPGPGPSLPSRSAWIIAIRATTGRISRLPRRCSVHPRRGSGALLRGSTGPWVHGSKPWSSLEVSIFMGYPPKTHFYGLFHGKSHEKIVFRTGGTKSGTPVLGKPYVDKWQLWTTQFKWWGTFHEARNAGAPEITRAFSLGFEKELMVRWAVFFFDSLIVGLYVFFFITNYNLL